MSRYLEEAAELVRKAAKGNEVRNSPYPVLLDRGRLECARQFAMLAAIDKGLLPVELAEEVYGQQWGPGVRGDAGDSNNAPRSGRS